MGVDGLKPNGRGGSPDTDIGLDGVETKAGVDTAADGVAAAPAEADGTASRESDAVLATFCFLFVSPVSLLAALLSAAVLPTASLANLALCGTTGGMGAGDGVETGGSGEESGNEKWRAMGNDGGVGKLLKEASAAACGVPDGITGLMSASSRLRLLLFGSCAAGAAGAGVGVEGNATGVGDLS